jgi:hypothetical protein
MNPRYPIYIPSKGRHEHKLRLTARALDLIGVPYRLVVEEQQYADYAREVPAAKLLVLDPIYQRDYDTLDDLGSSKSKGPGPARNFIWDHSISEGAPWHWVMDDNILCFRRIVRHMRIKVADGTVLRIMEDFALRYTNLAMCGPNYEMFAIPSDVLPQFVSNTRVYSCNLIRNDIPFRWRGRYNEDTILSLDILKAGWCTVQFNAFMAKKRTTQQMRGGNNDDFYSKEGTLPKSKMLADVHGDVARVVWKFGRWHHQVNYVPFKTNKLIRRADVVIPQGTNNYGMELREIR